MDEFALIRRYFSPLAPAGTGVVLGIGDDAALLSVGAGDELVVTTDTLVAGRHFPLDTAPFDIGWKALAVNLSDLAAMGAEARWFTLALTLPDADPQWLDSFAAGLQALARQHSIALVGGDTTRGPLSITITAMGSVASGAALRRSGARPGDLVCVTGYLGDAALALRLVDGRFACGSIAADQKLYLRARLDRPQPRLAAGLALRGLATAMIDLSDGLAGDLNHLLTASGCGAQVNCSALPASAAFACNAPQAERIALQVGGGDDYELCLCLPPEHLDTARARLNVGLTVIGRISAEPGLHWIDVNGARLDVAPHGYRHFA